MEYNLSMDEWAKLNELDRVELISNIKELPFQILVLASQDPSFMVRTALLSLLEKLTHEDISWLTLVRKMASSDPDLQIRESAYTLLKMLAGAG